MTTYLLLFPAGQLSPEGEIALEKDTLLFHHIDSV